MEGSVWVKNPLYSAALHTKVQQDHQQPAWRDGSKKPGAKDLAGVYRHGGWPSEGRGVSAGLRFLFFDYNFGTS
jgi:hypothetical protein